MIELDYSMINFTELLGIDGIDLQTNTGVS